MKISGLSLFCSPISIELLAELLSDILSVRALFCLVVVSADTVLPPTTQPPSSPLLA